MALYEHLAPVYDRLFPVNPATLSWIESLPLPSAGPTRRRVLDLGSATGGHALALAAAGWEALGLEPCAEMVALAREAAARSFLHAHFLEAGMGDIARVTGVSTFDLVLCLGNTLPHLRGAQALAAFLAASRDALKPGGLLLIQVLNYARLLRGEAPPFAPLVEGRLRFERRYEEGPGGSLRFLTRFTDGDRSYEDETSLHPFTPELIKASLEARGFKPLREVASWQGEPFSERDSAFLILAARAP